MRNKSTKIIEANALITKIIEKDEIPNRMEFEELVDTLENQFSGEPKRSESDMKFVGKFVLEREKTLLGKTGYEVYKSIRYTPNPDPHEKIGYCVVLSKQEMVEFYRISDPLLRKDGWGMHYQRIFPL